MNVICDDDSIAMNVAAFRLMARVQVIADINLDHAIHDMPAGAKRDGLIEDSKDRLALVELCSTLMAMHQTVVAELRIPKPGMRLLKVN